MTRRERMERRAERREDWAAKREASADAASERAHTLGAAIPFGQPILVGHHSERRDRNYRARIGAAMTRSVEDARAAERHSDRARGIARQLATSVFSDDEDAIERLRERIASREERRDRVRAFNASCRKGAPDRSLLTEKECDDLDSTSRTASYMLTKGGGFPRYVLTNLGAAIRKDKERMAEIERRAERSAEAEANGGITVSYSGDYCTVTFAEKPERSVLDALKASGFRWSGGSWHGRADGLPTDLRG